MYKTSLFFLFSLIFFSTFSQLRVPFQVGEYCSYRIHYGPINAGEATISVGKITKRNNETCFYFEGIGKTNRFFDLFFKVRDKYASFVQVDSLFPVNFIRNVNEGGHIIKQEYKFYHKRNIVQIEDSTYHVPHNIQDMLSGFYFARASIDYKNIKQDSLIELNIFMDEEVVPLKIKYERNELVKTRWGKIGCMVFTPELQKGRIFNEKESMKIWISDDKNNIIVKVQTKIIVGSIEAELISFGGLKNPLSISD